MRVGNVLKKWNNLKLRDFGCGKGSNIFFDKTDGVEVFLLNLFF